MTTDAFYKGLAKYYDFFFSDRAHPKESQSLRRIINKYKRSAGKELLEVACGTGRHLLLFHKLGYRVTGLDLNEEMLKVAKKKLKGANFLTADMIRFKIQKKFDVIACVFGSMGYARTPANLERMLKNFSKHLKPGGLVILESWVTPERFGSNVIRLESVGTETVKISRMGLTKRRGDVGIIALHWLIGENGGVRYAVDEHRLGLFDPKKVKDLMQKAGFKTYVENASWYTKTFRRPTFVGVKR